MSNIRIEKGLFECQSFGCKYSPEGVSVVVKTDPIEANNPESQLHKIEVPICEKCNNNLALIKILPSEYYD